MVGDVLSENFDRKIFSERFVVDTLFLNSVIYSEMTFDTSTKLDRCRNLDKFRDCEFRKIVLKT